MGHSERANDKNKELFQKLAAVLLQSELKVIVQVTTKEQKAKLNTFTFTNTLPAFLNASSWSSDIFKHKMHIVYQLGRVQQFQQLFNASQIKLQLQLETWFVI